MKDPTKKLLAITRKYNNARASFESAVREYIHTAEPLDPEMFWGFLDYFAQNLQERMQYTPYNPVESAAHNTILQIKKSVIGGEMNGWARAARFLASYRDFSDKLYKKCWNMPGVRKGDDGYGDWMDSLPLAGKEVVERILTDDLTSYAQITKGVEKFANLPPDFIMEGENYIKTTFQGELVKHFAYAVAGLASS